MVSLFRPYRTYLAGKGVDSKALRSRDGEAEGASCQPQVEATDWVEVQEGEPTFNGYDFVEGVSLFRHRESVVKNKGRRAIRWY